MSPMPADTTFSPDDLGYALREALAFTEAAPGTGVAPAAAPTVFALIPTDVLAQAAPGAVAEGDESVLSLLAEDPLPVAEDAEPLAALEQFLATASWPEPVVGAAVVTEIVLLSPQASADLPASEASADEIAAAALRRAAHEHPDAQRARVAVGALRGGRTLALLEVEVSGGERELRTHPELALDLQRALGAALAD